MSPYAMSQASSRGSSVVVNSAPVLQCSQGFHAKTFSTLPTAQTTRRRKLSSRSLSFLSPRFRHAKSTPPSFRAASTCALRKSVLNIVPGSATEVAIRPQRVFKSVLCQRDTQKACQQNINPHQPHPCGRLTRRGFNAHHL